MRITTTKILLIFALAISCSREDEEDEATASDKCETADETQTAALAEATDCSTVVSQQQPKQGESPSDMVTTTDETASEEEEEEEETTEETTEEDPPPPQPPGSPTGVTTTATQGGIDISWNNSSGADGYDLYWDTSSGVTKSSGTKVGSVTSPHTFSIGWGQPHYFVVVAKNAHGTSDESDEVDGTALPDEAVHISYHTGTALWVKSNATGVFAATHYESAAAVSPTSLALDSQGYVHVTYYQPSGVYLRYATNASGSWVGENVANGGPYQALAVDSADKVHIAYTNSSSHLVHAVGNAGSWTSYSVDTANSPRNVSVAIASNDRAHISYNNDAGTNGDLRYAREDAVNSYTVSTVASDAATKFDTFMTSIILDSTDTPHMSYINDALDHVHYATGSPGSWTISDLHGACSLSGRYSSIGVDSNDDIFITHSYSCGAYSVHLLEDSSGSFDTTYPNTWINSNNNTIKSTSIAIDANDKIHACFHDFVDLKVVYITNASGAWVEHDVATATPSAGAFCSIAVVGGTGRNNRP